MAQSNAPRLFNAFVSLLAAGAIIALFFAFKRYAPELHPPRVHVEVRKLPYAAFCSLSRMAAAYVLSLIFSLVYGTAAARSRARERIMIPIIDVAQSVPVIGFFPAAIYFFVSMARGRLGVELAAIFLIFTSMAWNMVLGVFESIRTIPIDSMEALDSFGASWWLKLKRLMLPACVPKLVYNSILSWVAGWYFLIACEIITVGPSHYSLPGLGSYLMRAADKGRWSELIIALLTLLVIIILMDAIIWQPLSAWAEKFRYEFAASAEPMRSIGLFDVLNGIGPTVVRAVRAIVVPVLGALHDVLSATPPFNPAAHPLIARSARILRTIATALALGLLGYALAAGGVAMFRTLAQPWPPIAWSIPVATVASFARLMVAYLISLAWTIPCAVYANENQRFAQRLASAAQILGSMPATALFPVIVVFVVRVTGGMNLASVLLILTGMQWYLLFNLLAGINQIPTDLKEAVRSFGLSRVESWRKLTLPAVVPSLLTGSITAWGGGWNALILSEYFVFGGTTYKVFGLGMLLDEAVYQNNNGLMILLTLLAMVLTVILLNRFVWRRLYDIATERFRMDY